MVAPVIIEAVSGLFGSLIKAVDEWHTSDEEKLLAKGKIFEAQGVLLHQVLTYEKSILEAQTNVIIAEAKGDSWLQRSWRPITMLFLMGLVGAYCFGFVGENLSESSVELCFHLVQIGLGGYVVGRSAEKVAKSINFKKAVETEE